MERMSGKLKIFALSLLVCGMCMAQSGTGSLFAKTVDRLKADGPSLVTGSATVSYGDMSGVQNFELSLSGSRFHIVLDDGETTAWFDSKTLWNGADYGNGIEEIYISNPSSEEVVLLNPSELLKRADSFKVTQKGKDTFIMEPKKNGEKVLGLSKVTVKVNPETFRPVQIDFMQDSNDPKGARNVREELPVSTTSIRISGWKPNQKFTDSMFTCPVDKYPEAEIIDLR